MIKKQSAQLSESCRSMQGSSKAKLFRFGAANDEFDGLARYSELKMAVGNLGGNAGKVLVPLGMESLFFYPARLAAAEFGWHREKRSSSQGTASLFLLLKEIYP